jgi:hypothetical protein
MLVCTFDCKDADVPLFRDDDFRMLGDLETRLLKLAANAVECSVRSNIDSLKLNNAGKFSGVFVFSIVVVVHEPDLKLEYLSVSQPRNPR